MRRFFNFVSKFLPRLANSIRGRGFRSLQDVLKDASTGTTAQRLQGLSKPDIGDGQRASAIAGVNSQDQYRVSTCLLYTSPSPRDRTRYRMPSSA